MKDETINPSSKKLPINYQFTVIILVCILIFVNLVYPGVLCSFLTLRKMNFLVIRKETYEALGMQQNILLFFSQTPTASNWKPIKDSLLLTAFSEITCCWVNHTMWAKRRTCICRIFGFLSSKVVWKWQDKANVFHLQPINELTCIFKALTQLLVHCEHFD